jgi:hypothetical protein
MKRTNSIINAVNETKADLVKPKRKYTKRVGKVVEVVKPEIRRETMEEVQLKQRLSVIEQCLIEKEKEVWTLECEVFDKKAIIKYLEEKLFAMGVRI